MISQAINLYEAKTQFSKLVDRAAAGEEIIIAKAGKPLARLMPLEPERLPLRELAGQNVLGLTYISPDFDAEDEKFNDLFYNGPLFPPEK